MHGSTMLKPQRQSDFTLGDFPPVFGKPWYWHRSTGTMESTRSLAQVIMEMQDELKHLEEDRRRRRRARGEEPGSERPREPFFEHFPGQPVKRPGGIEPGIENPYANLRRNASAPALDVQYKGRAIRVIRPYTEWCLLKVTNKVLFWLLLFLPDNTIMTVRRYSMHGGVNGKEGMVTSSSRRSDSGWGRLQDEVKHGSSSRLDMENQSKKQSLQDLVHKNRYVSCIYRYMYVYIYIYIYIIPSQTKHTCNC